jgi:hypothetical protein
MQGHQEDPDQAIAMQAVLLVVTVGILVGLGRLLDKIARRNLR